MPRTVEVLEPLSEAAVRRHSIWRQVEIIRRLSDRIIGIGPFGIGLDGVLAWVPGLNLIYGLGAGGLLIIHAFRAEASTATILRMGSYLAVDNVTNAVPIAGWAVDTLFPGHLMAARALQKDIEKRHGAPLKSTRSGRSRAGR